MRFALFVGCVSVFVACATEEPAPPDDLTPVEGLVLAPVVFSPAAPAPGATVTVAVGAPGATEGWVEVRLNDGAPRRLSTIRVQPNGFVASGQVKAPSSIGDVRVEAYGESDLGRIEGRALLPVTRAPCPTDQVRDATGCVPPVAGPSLVINRVGTIAAAHGTGDDITNMQHPRVSYRIDAAWVGCHTNHIGIFADAQLDRREHLLLSEDELRGRGFTEPPGSEDGTTPLVRTLLIEHGLGACEHLVHDEERGVVISSSRGTDADPGGIAVWRLPDLSAPPFEPVSFVDSQVGEDGIEGIVTRDGWVFAARKPDRIAVFSLDAQGRLQEQADMVVPGLGSAWELALDGDVLFITDPGVQSGGTGRLVTVDVSTPQAPVPLGWAQTAGPSKGLVVLPEDVVVVANGSAGLELFDVSKPAAPASLGRVVTSGTANGVAYENGLLAVANWESVRVYDASERGALRLLDGTDYGVLTQVTEDGFVDTARPLEDMIFQPTFGLGWVGLQDGRVIATDLDHLYVTDRTPGATSARLVLQDRRKQVRVGPDHTEAQFAVRFANAGREMLWVRVVDEPGISGGGDVAVLGSGETGLLEVELTGLDQHVPLAVTLESNDSSMPRRLVRLQEVDQQYAEGDLAPDFALPAINWCDGESCDMQAQCVSSTSESLRGKPILLAFFSSW